MSYKILLLLKLLESWSTISVAKFIKSLPVCLLVVNGSKIATKNFASFYEHVCKVDSVNNTESDLHPIYHGVPQGSF